MATLSKHGEEIGRLELLTSKVAYYSDGKILRNQGNGWKLFRKVKPGVNVNEAFHHRLSSQSEFAAQRPAFIEFKRQLHAIASFQDRYMVKAALEMLANDPDGLWSELNDMLRISCGVDEVVNLCRAYEASIQESKNLKTQPAVD